MDALPECPTRSSLPLDVQVDPSRSVSPVSCVQGVEERGGRSNHLVGEGVREELNSSSFLELP